MEKSWNPADQTPHANGHVQLSWEMSCASPVAAVVCVFLAKSLVKALENKDGKKSMLRALICTYIRCVTHTRKESNFQVRLASSVHSPKLVYSYFI